MADSIQIRKPDDWHLHVRDEEMLKGLLVFHEEIRSGDHDAESGAAGVDDGGCRGQSRPADRRLAARQRLQAAADVPSSGNLNSHPSSAAECRQNQFLIAIESMKFLWAFLTGGRRGSSLCAASITKARLALSILTRLGPRSTIFLKSV